MTIDLVIHTPDSTDAAWWAETPSVEGFTASADDLQSLLLFARQALTEILDHDFNLAYRLTAPSSAGDGVLPVIKEGSRLRELVA